MLVRRNAFLVTVTWNVHPVSSAHSHVYGKLNVFRSRAHPLFVTRSAQTVQWSARGGWRGAIRCVSGEDVT